MSKPIPPGLKPFKKGQSGNPSGRPKLSPEERRLVSLTKVEVARLLNMVADMTLDQMQEKFKDPLARGIEKLFIKTIIDGLKGDSVKAAEFILNRTVGKVQENVQITSLRRVVRKLDGTEIHYVQGGQDEDGT